MLYSFNISRDCKRVDTLTQFSVSKAPRYENATFLNNTNDITTKGRTVNKANRIMYSRLNPMHKL